jgi:hypothetical protein
MKPTDDFKKVISAKLQEMATADPLFAATMQKEKKNIDDCINYILNTVKASGCSGFTDDEIFGMAAHYYDEDDIKPGKAVKCGIVVNHTIELTKEEMKQARDEAMTKAVADERAKIYNKPVKTSTVQSTQPTLF